MERKEGEKEGGRERVEREGGGQEHTRIEC